MQLPHGSYPFLFIRVSVLTVSFYQFFRTHGSEGRDAVFVYVVDCCE